MSQLTFAAYPVDYTHYGCYMRRPIERHIILWVDNDLYNNHLALVAVPTVRTPRPEPEVVNKRIKAIDRIDTGIDRQNF
jgi:hypothetical protein